MADRFDDDFVAGLVAATADRRAVPGSSGRIGFGIGKKVLAVLDVVDGRVMGAAEGEPDVTLVFKGAQVDAWLAGELNLSQAYMRGDFKPTGSTGALTAALEILDDPATVSALAP